MGEETKGLEKQSPAQAFAEEILAVMRKTPEDCDLFDRLNGQIGNNPLVVFSGTGGGSVELAQSYLMQLGLIHAPYCTRIPEAMQGVTVEDRTTALQFHSSCSGMQLLPNGISGFLVGL